jgi:hypothetical protein
MTAPFSAPPMSPPTELTQLPLVAGPWEADWLPIAANPASLIPPPRKGAGVLLMVDVIQRMTVMVDTLETAPPRELARRILRAMAEPFGGLPPARPAVLRVRNEDLARELRKAAGDAIPSVQVVEKFEMLDRAVTMLDDDLRQRGLGSIGGPREDECTSLLLHAAVDFYKSRPWRVLPDEVAIRIQIDDGEPLFASVMGDTAFTHGLLLYRGQDDPRTIDPTLRRKEGHTSLGVTFVPEREVPEDWSARRRLHQLPVASSSAFPVPLVRNNGVGRLADAGEMRTLALALRALVAFVAANRKRLERGTFTADSVELSDESGSAHTISVSAPADPREESATPPPPEGGRCAALDDMRTRSLQLDESADVLGRLIWSFFQGREPSYLPLGPERAISVLRFLDWAVFCAPAGVTTLAERALVAAEGELDGAVLADRRRLIQPRAGAYRVEKVEEGAGLHVRDIGRNEPLFIRDRGASSQVRVGEACIGVLHQVADDAWVMSAGVIFVDDDAPLELPGTDIGARDLGPALEQVIFGASPSWMDSAPFSQVKREYASFRGALAATGASLPPFETIREKIRAADGPVEVFHAVIADVDWWSDQEVAVTMSFVQRIWNATPRTELGGKSPDEVAGKQRKRASGARGGARRKRRK